MNFTNRGDQGQGQGQRLKFRHQDDVVGSYITDERRKLDGGFRYRHLANEDIELVDNLLQGKMELCSMPVPKSNVVKIFISSTFTDMTQERNALAETVYPRLRKYCRDRHGIDFQAVDMRWGVPNDASDDHSGPHICLSELSHCQELSIGPNFVALIGQRYGTCPLPAAVKRAEFEAIRTYLESSADEVDLLDTCYLKDMNSHPALYKLQPASKIKDATGRAWSVVEPDIRRILYKGAQRAVEASEMSRDSLRILKASVTELEIYQGLINISRQKQRDANCVIYIRDIDGLTDETDKKILRRYTDLLPESSEPNVTATKSLEAMKERCVGKIQHQNLLKRRVLWHGHGIEAQNHQDYLHCMCNHFYATVKVLVDRNMAKRNKLQDDDLYNEVIQHWSIAKERCKTFVGRVPLLQRINEYLDSQSDQAFVVYAESGSGKTSLMSKAVSLVNEAIVNGKTKVSMAVAVRFIGTTPVSSSIHQLLYSLCHQLAYIGNQRRSEVPEDYTSLKIYFRSVVQNGDFTSVVVIFLDALDQLSGENGAHSLDWLPSRLAPNVKVVVSTLPDKYGILKRLRNKIDDNFLEVSPLPQIDCKQIMKVLLEQAEREIMYFQWRLVEEAFSHCTLPLFITLTFQEALRWNSYDVLTHNALQHTVEAAINQLFDRLEQKHGRVFVSRSIGYITAARNGLSETELDDVLSLDDDVLNSIFTYWEPPIRRVPPNVWPSLYNDIKSFLVEREADDCVVLNWYHIQFVDVATGRYLSNKEEFIAIHNNLADYYMGVWSGDKEKPFVYRQMLMDRLHLTNPHSRACRYVPEQPLIFKTTAGSERYNYRKLNQLPFSLMQSGQITLLKKECFCNFDWLHAKLKAGSLQQILGDFAIYKEYRDKETNMVADALRMSGSALKLDINALGPEISGRLLPHIHKYPLIRNLVRQSDRRAQQTCPLVPQWQIYSVPGGPLQYEWEMEERIRSSVDVDVFNSPDGILMTAKPYYSKTLKIWELTQGEPRQDIQLPIGEIHPTKDGKYLNIFSKNRHLTSYKSDCGEVHAHIDCGYGEVAHVNISNNYIAFTTRHGSGPSVVDVKNGRFLHKFNYRSCAVVISKEEGFVVFNTDRHIMLYSLPLMQRKCLGTCNDEPMQIAFNDTRMKGYVLTKTKLLQSIHFDLRNRKPTVTDIIEDIEAKEFVMSHTEDTILVRSARCLYLIDANNEVVKHRLQKMPPGVFQKTMSSFTGAGFTPNDDLVVASRDTFIAVWETITGAPIRLLQASVSPIVKIFTSDTLNKAVSLLQDNTLQVWDLNNLDADVQHSNEVIDGLVYSLAVSSETKEIVCHGIQHPEAKIVDIRTGQTKAVLQHSKDLDDKIIACELSPLGSYVVTRGFLAGGDDYYPGVKCILTDDKVWNMTTREVVSHSKSSRFVLFNSISSLAVLVQSVFYSSIDWTCNSYKAVVFEPDVEKEQEPEFYLPSMSEFICKPVVITARRETGSMFHAFYTVLQFCQKEFHPITKVEISRCFYTKLYVQPLLHNNPEESILGVEDFLKHAEKNDHFVHVQTVYDDKLLLVYAKEPIVATFDKETGLKLPTYAHKAAILYDPVKQTVLRHLLHIVKRDSILTQMLVSRLGSIIVDDQLRVFDHKVNTPLTTIGAKFAKEQYRLALDGEYVVGIMEDLRSVQVVRARDGVNKGRMFIHGKAACLEIAEDDRTVVIGCHDGRVMIVSLVLELEDHVAELIDKLPSRIPPLGHRPSQVDIDISHMQQLTPELTRLSLLMNKNWGRKRIKLKTLANGVIALNRFGVKTQTSQACSVM